MVARISFVSQVVCFVAMCLMMASTSAFVVSAPAARASALASRTASSSTLRTSTSSGRAPTVAVRMSEEEEVTAAEPVDADPSADATQSVKSFFAPNENIRLGSSRDQDGKSNVWAVEPKMRVEGADVESPESNKLAITGAIIAVLVVAMSATIAFLPNADTL